MSDVPQLRPRSVTELFDAAFHLYRKHFVTFVGIVALLHVPMTILMVLAQIPYAQALQTMTQLGSGPAPAPDPDIFSSLPWMQMGLGLGLIMLLSMIQYLIVTNLITGALANTISRSYLGQPISILEGYQIGWKRFGSLIAASLIPALAWLAVSVLLFGCIAGVIITSFFNSSDSSPGIIVILMLTMILLIFVIGIVSLFVYVRLIFTTQAIVLEDHGPWAGIVRSWRLVGLSFWRIVGILALTLLLSYVLVSIVQVPFSLLISFGSFGANNFMLTQSLSALVSNLVMILLLPFQLTMYTLLYYDVRIRKEGLDFELRTQQTPLV
jgi:hypothetical protein